MLDCEVKTREATEFDIIFSLSVDLQFARGRSTENHSFE